MAKFYSKSDLVKRCFALGLVALGLLWVMAERPEAHEKVAMPATGAAPGRAADILLLTPPKSVRALTDGWHPAEELAEVRAELTRDLLVRVFGRFPRRIEPGDGERLARMLVQEGRRAGIDPVFLAALIRIESAFSKEAVSCKGARGLMQLMPATGEEVALELGMEWNGPDQLHDVEFNVRLGVHYLRWLLQLYAGNYRFALTAYNRGPASVRSIMRRHGSLAPEFTEYFRKIQHAYRRYRRSMKTTEAAFLELG